MSIQYTADQLQRKFSGPSGLAGFARIGEGLRTEGRLDEAIQTCQDGLRLRPTHLTGHLVLGKSLIDAGRPEEAREQFEAALRLDARCLSAMRYLADIMNLLKMGDVATGYYRSILEVEPWDAEIRSLLGNAPEPSDAYSGTTPGSNELEDTYLKPDGFTSDVMEVNLNEISDFLPSHDADMLLAPASDATAIDAVIESIPEAVAEDKLEFTSEAASEITPETDAVAQMDATMAIEIAPSPDKVPVLPEMVLDSALVEEVRSDETETIPISGLDLEDRLDSLFGLQGPAPEAEPAAGLALDPEPAAADASNETHFSTATEMIEVNASGDATAFQANDFNEQVIGNLGSEQDRVLGVDIEQRLDDLFSLSEEEKSPPIEKAELIAASETTGVEKPEADFDESVEALPQVNDGIMSTESMLPVSWLADAEHQPPVTGADIEAQLDRLFDLNEASDAFDDQTLTFPTLKDSQSKEPVSDWQASQGEKEIPPSDTHADLLLESAETMMIPTDVMESLSEVELAPDFDATLEIAVATPKSEKDMPNIQTSIESESLTETTSMEMVDGADVANRLDELFTEDSSNTETMSMEFPKSESESPADSETIVTGEEVASRISEIFEPAKDAASELKTTMSTSSQGLQPLMDEEDAYPEEEESVSQTEGGANVATVTLAEIYFQQGLREQALQIYRQLLELEPGNDSVRNRINEIEASRPDGENQEPGGSEPSGLGPAGQGQDSQRPDGQRPDGQRPGGSRPDSNTRRPRPGFKIPKRKK